MEISASVLGSWTRSPTADIVQYNIQLIQITVRSKKEERFDKI